MYTIGSIILWTLSMLAILMAAYTISYLIQISGVNWRTVTTNHARKGLYLSAGFGAIVGSIGDVIRKMHKAGIAIPVLGGILILLAVLIEILKDGISLKILFVLIALDIILFIVSLGMVKRINHELGIEQNPDLVTVRETELIEENNIET